MNQKNKFNKVIKTLFSSIILVLLIFSCKDLNTRNIDERLKKSLLFYASFDTSTTADFAKGDPKLYDAPSRKYLDSTSNTLRFAPSVEIDSEVGKFGGSLKFKDNIMPVVFYKAEKNVNFQLKNWSGTISLWLKVSPDNDLTKNYVDPIQITETYFSDAGIWTDFTPTSKKRMFRLGVAGDSASWSSNDEDISNKEFYHRVRGIVDPPFSNDSWTHVAITHFRLGSGNGSANLYINGVLAVTHSPIKDPFTWEHNDGKIFLGLRYSGYIDELTIFDRALTKKEIKHIQKTVLTTNKVP
jgi:hypothetical protein